MTMLAPTFPLTLHLKRTVLAGVCLASLATAPVAHAQVPVKDAPVESYTQQTLDTVNKQLTEIIQILQATQKIQMATGTAGAGMGGIGSMMGGAGMGLSGMGGGGGMSGLISGLTGGGGGSPLSGLMGGGSNPISGLMGGGSSPLSGLMGGSGSNPISGLMGGAGGAGGGIGSILGGVGGLASGGNPMSAISQIAGGIQGMTGGSGGSGSGSSGSGGYAPSGGYTAPPAPTAPLPVDQATVVLQDPNTQKWYSVTMVEFQDPNDGNIYDNYYYQDMQTMSVSMTSPGGAIDSMIGTAMNNANFVGAAATTKFVGTTAEGYSSASNTTSTGLPVQNASGNVADPSPLPASNQSSSGGLSILQAISGMSSSMTPPSGQSNQPGSTASALGTLISAFNAVVTGATPVQAQIQALQSTLYINSSTAPTSQQIEAVNDMRRINLQNAAITAAAVAASVTANVGQQGQQNLQSLASSAQSAGDIRSDLAANTSVMMKNLEQTLAQNALLASMLHLMSAQQIANDGLNGREAGKTQQ